METCKFIVVLLSYCVCAVSAYPSRPLNERSPDLTWEAWLLVDDQNQNKQLTNADGSLRRRITPKSIFIAPTFSPESLPACADGYSADMMGRCIKIIKLDQDAHYEFLIEKLKEKFSSLDYEDYEDEEEVVQTAGPLQVNIPLDVDGADAEKAEEEEEETDIAIIVSPTMANFDTKRLSLDKRNSLDDEYKQEVDLKSLTGVKVSETVTATTPTESTSTVTEEAEDFSTLPTTTDSTTTTFWDSEESQSTETGSEETTTTEIPFSASSELVTVSEVTTLSPRPLQATPSIVVRFPDDLIAPPLHDDDSIKQSDDPVVFRDVVMETGSTNLPAVTTRRPPFNRRNRDKHFGLFPPRWSSQGVFERPVVLRFSRKNAAHFDTTQFKNEEYYRAIPAGDLAYLFKFKYKRSDGD